MLRIFEGEENVDLGREQLFAMKMMHKPVLMKQRAVKYSDEGEMEIINNLDKVYNEVETWAQVSHPNIIKIYEIIDAEELGIFCFECGEPLIDDPDGSPGVLVHEEREIDNDHPPRPE